MGLKQIVLLSFLFFFVSVTVCYFLPIDMCENGICLSDIKKQNIRFPRIVFYQILLETSFCENPKSLCYPDDDNTFNYTGMKYPRVRKTTSIGEYKGHAVYSSFEACLADYKLFQEYYKVEKIKNEKEYLEFLSLYAKDEEYTKKLNELRKSNKYFRYKR